jgi:L-aspartate oxidase
MASGKAGARKRAVKSKTGGDDYDVLVVGSGVAGLFLSLRLAETLRVAVVTKREDYESSTNYAQGGIAVATGPADTIEQHVKDTIQVGAGLCDEEVVRTIVSEGPGRLADLIELGVRFTHGKKGLSLGREGGHSRRRIVHAGDFTGREIERALVTAALAHPNITVLEEHLAVDLILDSRLGARRRTVGGDRRRGQRDAVWGAYVLDRNSRQTKPYRARATVIATGGSGKVYLYTSNPDVATGDGVAMAYRAGASIANLEFFQFHPTCLYDPMGGSFLISEAVRGEGARLHTMDGKRFMTKVHPQAELAPRDIVARAIDREMKRRGDKYVLLDLTVLGKTRLTKRFPNIYRHLRSLGYDPAGEPVPVVPAAHYQCGGVCTDLHGHASLDRLYAVGEVAMTGLHGANRLASNSLLEAVVMAHRTAAAVSARLSEDNLLPAVSAWREKGTKLPVEEAALAYNWEAVRRLMWDRVGIVRSDERLESARDLLRRLRAEIERDYRRYRLSADLVELRNLSLVAELVVECARQRKESRGLHFNIDHPRPSPRFRKDTVLIEDLD